MKGIIMDKKENLNEFMKEAIWEYLDKHDFVFEKFKQFKRLSIHGVEVTQSIQYYRAEEHLTDPADRGPDNSLPDCLQMAKPAQPA